MAKKKMPHCSSYDCEGEGACACACDWCLPRRLPAPNKENK